MLLHQVVMNRPAIDAPPAIEADVAGIVGEILELLVDHQTGTALTSHFLSSR